MSMKYVNNFGLPEGLANFVETDEYSIGAADYSYSNLSSPPQLRRLTKLHFDDIEIDVADQLWLILGKAFHKLIAEAESHIIMPEGHKEKEIEKRFYMNVGGFVISGQMDKFSIVKSTIEDYKVTNMYKVLRADHDDWINQLNVYNLLLRANGHTPKQANINAILKDYNLKEKNNYGEDFPPKPFKVLPIELKDPLDTLEYVIERIRAHEAVKNIDDPKELFEVSPCTEKDRWAKPDKWVVKKVGGKRAVPNGTFDNEADAKMLQIDKGNDYVVEYVPGRSVRCEKYCAVSQWCYQNKIRQPQLIMPEAGLPKKKDIIDPQPPTNIPESEPEVMSLFADEDKKSPTLPDPVGVIEQDDILPELTPAEEKALEPEPKPNPVNKPLDSQELYKKLMADSGVTKDTPFAERLAKDKEVQWKILGMNKPSKRGVMNGVRPESTVGDDVEEPAPKTDESNTNYNDLLNSLLGDE